jgi:uncharacterized protein (DUF952 family)
MADQTCAWVSIPTSTEKLDDRNYCLSAQVPIGSAPKRSCEGACVTTIYKICERAAWQEAERAGIYGGSDVDRRDGFIHFSTAAQVAETAAKHFAGRRDLMLIGVDGDTLGAALKWERSRGGDLFPHLYAALSVNAARWARPLPDEVNGRRALPGLEP